MNDNQLRVKGWLCVYNHKIADLQHPAKLATRRECSLSERSREIRSVFHWQFHCSHDKLWCTKCARCEAIGITRAERDRRFAAIVAKHTHA